MALVNSNKREINAKLVYYGPGLAGKTTSVNHVYGKLKPEFRGQLKTMNVQSDRMFFFDFTPPGDANVNGYNVRLHIYTLKGEPSGPAPWKMVLKGVDGIVFVADSSPERMAANRESLQNLDEYLKGSGQSISDIPLVFAYNKRDQADAVPVDEMQRVLNPRNRPGVPVAATKGEGVLNALLTLVKMVLKKLREERAGLEPSLDAAISPAGAATDEREMGGYDIEEELVAEPEPVSLPSAGEGAEPEISFLGHAEILDNGHMRLPLVISYGGREKTVTLDLKIS
ncbi:ADP-ribosylation factor-like protein [Geotalea sp. SG265]|uniref:GTP-binding protein n=1 Tax=Geotalea sp. SG265 TaxID=2922867 RepID=UPI001FAFBDA2|nr:ADP-ribosylation factor-like protein [Geotalea sp. SG265]